ncbi:MAG: hypothetical protein ACFFB3_07495, partial [Candidatus Hodarchaeota archaeon]
MNCNRLFRRELCSIFLIGFLGGCWCVFPIAGAAKPAQVNPVSVKFPDWTNSTLDWKHTAVKGRASHPSPSHIAVATDHHLAMFDSSGQTILEPVDLGGPGVISGVAARYPGPGPYCAAWSKNGAWMRVIQAWTGTMVLNDTFNSSLKAQIYGAELALDNTILIYWGRISAPPIAQAPIPNGFLRVYQIGSQYDRYLWNYSIPGLIDAAISQTAKFIVAINGSHLFLWDTPWYNDTPKAIAPVQNGTIVGVGHAQGYNTYIYWANDTHLSIWRPDDYMPTGFNNRAIFPLQAPVQELAVGAMGISAYLWGHDVGGIVRYLMAINATGWDIDHPEPFNVTFEFDPGQSGFLNSGPKCSEWGRYWVIADGNQGIRFYHKNGTELWHTGNNYTSVAMSED